MGYFSTLAIELLEGTPDRELIDIEDEFDSDKPVTNQELAAAQQEEQFSIWNEQYRQQLEQSAKAPKKEQPKVYKKTRG